MTLNNFKESKNKTMILVGVFVCKQDLPFDVEVSLLTGVDSTATPLGSDSVEDDQGEDEDGENAPYHDGDGHQELGRHVLCANKSKQSLNSNLKRGPFEW